LRLAFLDAPAYTNRWHNMAVKTPVEVTIYHGENAGAAVIAAASRPDGIILRSNEELQTPVPWGAFRSFLAQGRAALGD